MKTKNQHIPQLRFKYYTYELIDPLNDIVFYIGKGKDNRIHDHVRKVKSNSKNQSNVHKNNKIREILGRGQEVIEQIHGSYDTQEEAIDAEMELIANHGIENLTNFYKKGTVQKYRKYHIQGFVSMVKLLVSMFARIKSIRKDELINDEENDIMTKAGIYKAMDGYMIKISESVDRKYFMDILNSEIDKKWTGVSRAIV